MAKSFGDAERHILGLFQPGTNFIFNNRKYAVIFADKPTCNNGEPKTDIFIWAKADVTNLCLKISFKKQNADFLENKMNSERAEQIFGSNWKNIIANSTNSIRDKFLARKLIYKTNYKKIK